MAESEEIRQAYSTEFLLNTATIREVTARLQLTSFCLKSCGERNTELRAITTPNYKQPQTLRTTKNSIESTYSDLPCDLKVTRGKLALINRT